MVIDVFFHGSVMKMARLRGGAAKLVYNLYNLVNSGGSL